MAGNIDLGPVTPPRALPDLPTQVNNNVNISRFSNRTRGIQSLADLLFRLVEKSNFHDCEQEYFPANCVRQLITQSVIERELSKANVDAQNFELEEERALFDLRFQQRLANWINEHAPKTFATAVISGLQPLDLLAYMVTFRSDEIGRASCR